MPKAPKDEEVTTDSPAPSLTFSEGTEDHYTKKPTAAPNQAPKPREVTTVGNLTIEDF